MSVGHRTAALKVDEAEANRLITDPRIAKRLAQKPTIDRSFDIPYVAGYSRNGKTVYIDRHLNLQMPYRGRKINILPLITLHEILEKALIDVCGFKYQKAHSIAEHFEDKSAKAAGIDVKRYDGFFKPYIKADSKEKLVRVPKDLDLTPYIDSRDYLLLNHLKAKINAVDKKRA